MVPQSSAKNSPGWQPEPTSDFGSFPRASSGRYPVTLLKLGFTYSIFPSRSVIMTVMGAWSMASHSSWDASFCLCTSCTIRLKARASLPISSPVWICTGSSSPPWSVISSTWLMKAKRGVVRRRMKSWLTRTAPQTAATRAIISSILAWRTGA